MENNLSRRACAIAHVCDGDKEEPVGRRRYAICVSDGHGGDYAFDLSANIAIVDITQDLLDRLRGAHAALGHETLLDEVRLQHEFRVFRDEGDCERFPGWRENGVAIVPADFTPDTDEGRTECCSIAIYRDGKTLQLHCLPKYGDAWLRSYTFTPEFEATS